MQKKLSAQRQDTNVLRLRAEGLSMRFLIINTKRVLLKPAGAQGAHLQVS